MIRPRILYLAAYLGLLQAQVVEEVCPGTGSTCGGLSTIQARGFQTSLPWDEVNEGFLYWAGSSGNTGIYSDAVYFYNPATKTFVLKVSNGATATAHCGQTGAPYDVAEPLNGHPEGTFWTSGTHAFMTGQLCGGQRPGFTNRYVLSTETMTTRLAVGIFGTGDGTHNGGGQSFQQVRYAPNVSKAFYCCYSGGGATPKVVEFNSTAYTDVTASLTGGTIPGPLTGFGMVYLGGLLYVYGGCIGTSPGNNGDCATPHTGIFSINPSTYAVTLLSPSGTAPSSTYASFPLMAADSLRSRILVWDGTNMKAYSVSGNSWSNVTLSGDTPIVLPTGSGGSGNMAGYDPVRDIMVMIVSRSQSFTPQVQNVQFGNGGPIDADITISEAIYPGSTTGVARTDEPFVVGVPIADSVGLENVNTLALAGATAGQFRSLGVWPSGNIKWVQVSGIEDSLSAGSTSTVTLSNDGSGNFGGSDLATDNGTTITVSTNGGTCGAGSAICFDIKKANFNVLNRVRIGGTEILATSTAETRGLVLTGPAAGGAYPANVTCTPESGGAACTVVFSSANDADSTCAIEQNGPVMAVLKCTGQHEDSSNNPYMKFTARLYFYKGKSYVKVNSILRNADYGTSGTFATAYKGFDGYELRLDPALTGTLSWTIANETATPASGTMSGTDNVYIYQGLTTHLKWQDFCGSGCVDYTANSGWRLNVNASDADSGVASEVIGGWGNIENSSGVGIQIGVYQMTAYYPKSLEFLSGGDDVRVGIWSARNTSNHYQSWPQHSIHDVFLNFHATTLSAANARDAFLKFQHYLVGRAAVDHYNESGALITQLTTSAAEDAYMAAAASNASPVLDPDDARPILDWGTTFPTWPLNIYRWYAHNSGGGANQDEFRWSDMLQFFKRGFAGRLLNSSHFYRWQAEQTFPHADGFQWQDHTGEYNGFAQPTATSGNSALAHRNWHDQEHHHWWGMCDHYFMTGDDAILEAILDGPVDFFTDATEAAYGSGLPGGKSGTVDTSGTAVTSATGSTFAADMVGSNVKIGSATYRIATYNSATSLTLATSAGTQTGAQYYQGGGPFNTRAIGGHLTGAAVLSSFLDAVGETASATAVRAQGDQLFKLAVESNGCMNGHPSNCSLGALDGGPWPTGGGINRKRGAHWGPAGTSGTWCGVSHTYRVNSAFQTSILIRGLIEYSTLRGVGWSEYWNARDLAYGLSQFSIGHGAIAGELYVDDGSGVFTDNGFRFGIAFDRENNCSGGGEVPEDNFPPPTFGQQTIWNPFWAQHLTNGGKPWETKFKIAIQKLTSVSGIGTSDFGGAGINNVIGIVNDPGTATLQSLTLTAFEDNADNTYDLSVTVPTGCEYYRVKYSPLTIVDWIGFDPGTNTFVGNPTTTENWFAATNASSIPSCATSGTTQVITVNAGQTGLVAANFSVKAMAGEIEEPPSGVSSRFSGGGKWAGGNTQR